MSGAVRDKQVDQNFDDIFGALDNLDKTARAQQLNVDSLKQRLDANLELSKQNQKTGEQLKKRVVHLEKTSTRHDQDIRKLYHQNSSLNTRVSALENRKNCVIL